MKLYSHYDLIAEEYYSSRHITSRNFDATTEYGLKNLDLRLPGGGLVLELGAGKGRANQFLGIAPSRIIQLDSSVKMLELQERETCLLRVLCNAESTPFLNDQFAVCAAFLCDPFWSSKFLREVFRLLNSEGFFIASLPSFTWGSSLRQEIDIPIDRTTFITKSGEQLEVPSILVSKDLMLRQLLEAGFDESSIRIKSFTLPKSVSTVSPHVTISASKQQMSVYDIELVDIVTARK